MKRHFAASASVINASYKGQKVGLPSCQRASFPAPESQWRRESTRPRRFIGGSWITMSLSYRAFWVINILYTNFPSPKKELCPGLLQPNCSFKERTCIHELERTPPPRNIPQVFVRSHSYRSRSLRRWEHPFSVTAWTVKHPRSCGDKLTSKNNPLQ